MLQRLDEIIRRDPSLLEQPGQGADFQLTMVGHDATGGAATHHHVTAALASYRKSQTLQGMDDIRARHDGQLRHDRALGTT